MKTLSRAHSNRNLALLELARSRAKDIRTHWRESELGSWEEANPSWHAAGERILFRFCFQGRRFVLPVVSIKSTPFGIKIFLESAGSPVPEAFDMKWQKSASNAQRDFRKFWNAIRAWLTREFPGCQMVQCAKRPDRARTLSGLFLRASFRHRGKESLLIAADEDVGDEIPLAISQALLWLQSAGQKRPFRHIPVIHILVPAEFSAITHHRCMYMDRSLVEMEVWEYETSDCENYIVRRAPALPEPQENKDYRWPVLGPFRWSSNLEKVLNLAPDLIRRYPRFCEYDSLRLWGLEFAQVTGVDRDRICFGVGPMRTELTTDSFDALKALIQEILYFRRPDSPDIQHPYYRLQAERWLEALVLEDIARLFPEMAPEAVYSQIPVYLGRNPGRIDILGANCRGDLVVMELKVAADADLPVQALDYRGRVIQHNRNGDFVRRGYFSEVRLSRRPPLIYMISPVFSFHDSTEVLLHYLDPDLDIHKIAINEDWRCGVKILARTPCRIRMQDGNSLKADIT